MTRPNVIVAGAPGAMCAQVSLTLEKSGYLLNWATQDMDVGEAQKYAAQGVNVELSKFHLQLLRNAGTDWTTMPWPQYFDVPYPGPAEIAHQFQSDAVFCDRLLPLFLTLWQPYAVAVVDIQSTAEEDLQALRGWTGGTLTDAYLKKLAEAYRQRYTAQLKSWGQVFQLTNGEIRQSRFDGLAKFLGQLS